MRHNELLQRLRQALRLGSVSSTVNMDLLTKDRGVATDSSGESCQQGIETEMLARAFSIDHLTVPISTVEATHFATLIHTLVDDDKIFTS